MVTASGSRYSITELSTKHHKYIKHSTSHTTQIINNVTKLSRGGGVLQQMLLLHVQLIIVMPEILR